MQKTELDVVHNLAQHPALSTQHPALSTCPSPFSTQTMPSSISRGSSDSASGSVPPTSECSNPSPPNPFGSAPMGFSQMHSPSPPPGLSSFQFPPAGGPPSFQFPSDGGPPGGFGGPGAPNPLAFAAAGGPPGGFGGPGGPGGPNPLAFAAAGGPPGGFGGPPGDSVFGGGMGAGRGGGQAPGELVTWHHAARFARAGKQQVWNAWDEDWMKAGHVSRLRNRLLSSRVLNRRGNSCSTCRQEKKKCDGCAPCGRCAARGLNCSLRIDTEPEPVPSVICHTGTTTYTAAPSMLARARTDTSLTLPYARLNQLALMRRFPRGPIKKMFKNMTPYLLDTISLIMKGLPEVPGSPPPAIFQQTSVAPVKDMLQSLADASFPACCFESSMDHTQGVFSVNQKFADHMGMHMEEVVARTICGERPYVQSEIRIFTLLFVILRKKRPFDNDMWYIASKVRGSYCYMRFSFKVGIRMTPTGPKIRFTGSMVYLNVEEYKAGVAQNPYSSDSLGLPWLDEFPDHDAETFDELSRTEEGRRKMDMLADTLRELFSECFQ